MKTKKKYFADPKTVCEDAISRQAAIEAIEERFFAGTVADINPSWRLLHEIIESLPQVEPKRPKTTETMMIDGEPTEIDPLSYEVGYSHGQSERPKREWGDRDGWSHCSNCEKYATPHNNGCEIEPCHTPFCPWCGADMRGEEK